jgi:UDP-glucose 4-epimerase
VTGSAGFIGSHLVDRLLAAGHEVVGYDNFSTGHQAFIENAIAHGRFRQVRGDVLEPGVLGTAMRGVEVVFHLAANADVRFGLQHPRRDLEQNTLGTFNVLEAMREAGVRRIAFSSTGSVYGEPHTFPTPETAPFPVQTSLYGASKLAGESLIQAYCQGYGFQGYIFRFVSILGERYTHGHVVDFYRQLRAHPDRLDVLGDGHQRKSYLYVQDCIDAMLLVIERGSDPLTILNLGTDEYCEVSESVAWISAHLGLSPRVVFGGGTRGWIGDSPFIFLDCSAARQMGWRPSLTIRDSVIRTVAFLERNAWILDRGSEHQPVTLAP